MLIAIDGSSASGKSTVASELARRLVLPVVETGLLYRSFAWFASQREMSDLPGLLTQWCGRAQFHGDAIEFDGIDHLPQLKDKDVGRYVADYSALEPVRTRITEIVRDYVRPRSGGVVVGRDVGTVIFPNADLKLYLTTDLATAARRRATAEGLDEREVAAMMAMRDQSDRTRSIGPLRAAADAWAIDTEGFSVHELIEMVLSRAHR